MRVVKFVLAFFVFIVVCYGVSSWYMGREAQALIERELAQANEQVLKAIGPDTGLQDIQIRIRSYDRGIFTSQAEYELRWQDDEGRAVNYAFSDRLQHGPFPLAALRQGNWAPALAFSEAQLQKTDSTAAWVDSLEGDSPVLIRTFVGFGGKGVSNWIFREANFSEADGSKVAFSGGQVDIRFSDNFRSHHAVGDFNKLQLSDADASAITMEAISLDSEKMLSPSGERTVDSEVNVARIALTTPEMPDVVLNQTGAAIQATQVAGLLTGQVSYGVEAVEFNDAQLGSVVAQASADRLNMSALTALVQEYDAIRSADTTSDDLPQLDDDQARQLRTSLFAFLNNQPGLVLGLLVWTNPQGQGRIQLDADFVEPDQALLDAPADQLLLAVLGRLSLSVEIERAFFEALFIQLSEEKPERASAMARMMFDAYAARLNRAGVAVYENNTLKIDAFYEDDTIRLNGEVVGLTSLLQRLFQGVL